MIPTLWLSQVNPNAFNASGQLRKRAAVAIVGGGLMGVSAAYWLAKLGVRVLLMEAETISCGSSGRNAGLMLPGTSPIEDPQLSEAVMKEEQIAAGYSITGHLALASSIETWQKMLQEVATRPERLSPIAALDRSSCEDLLKLRIDCGFFGGRWFPDGRVIHSAQFVYGLCNAAQRHGAVIVSGTRVLQVDKSRCNSGFRIRTNRGTVCADHVIYACSSNIVKFVPTFRKVITEVVAQVLSTMPVRQLFTIGLAIDWGTFYWRQTLDGNIILGGGDVLKSRGRPLKNNGVNPRAQRVLEKFLPSVFPDMPPIDVAFHWAGVMDCTCDSKPIVGPVPDRPGEWVIGGFGGHGMPLGVNIGKAVADAIVNGKWPGNLDSFNPSRFN
jgi:gamma-glutamylputrescine oxidase